MKRKSICSLFVVIMLLFTALPVFSLGVFNVGNADFYYVVNGYENPVSELVSGTMRAKVKFSNTTNEDYDVSLYLCTKESGTGRLKALNTKSFTIPTSLSPSVCAIDVTVSDNTQEDLFLYVWDENNAPFCAPVSLEGAKTYENSFKVEVRVTQTYKTDYNLVEGSVGKIRLELSETPESSELEGYSKYSEFSYTEARGYRFDVAEGNIFSSYYVGCYVIAELAPNAEGALEIKSIYPDASRSNILTVSEDIELADVATDGRFTFEYWKDIVNDVKATEVDIKTDASVYVNGEKIGDSAAAQAAFESLDDSSFSGSVRFVGSKGDDFDVVFITEYDYAMVEAVDLDYEAIECDNGYIELSDAVRIADFIYNIYKDGKKISLSDIQKDDVISVVAQGNNIDEAAYLDIFVSSEKVVGAVTAANGDTYYVNDVAYKTVGTSMTVGTEGTFFITHDGKIYDCKTDPASLGDYGFIMQVKREIVSAEHRYQLTLLTSDGSVKTYDVDTTLKVIADVDGQIETNSFKTSDAGQDEIFAENGGSDYNIPAMLEADTEANAEEKVALRLIRYKLSADEEISQLTFAAASGTDGEDYNLKIISNGTYKQSSGKFGSYYFGEDTVLFYAPIKCLNGDFDAGWGVSEEDAVVINTDMLDADQDYTAYAYATDSKVMGAAMIVSDLGFAGKNKPIAVCTGVSTGVNSDGEQQMQVTLFQSGTTKIYFVGENVTELDGVAVGDIIQFMLGINGEIYRAEIVYDKSDGLTWYADMITFDESDVEFAAGYVVENFNGAVTLDADFEDSVGTDYSFYCDDESTLAILTEANEGRPNYLTKIEASDSFKYTNTQSSAPIVYYMVARMVDGEIVDAVEYNLGQMSN